MSKVVLFGGNSALGLATASRIMETRAEVTSCLRISRSNDSDICWNPIDSTSAQKTLDSISFDKNDICIIALGQLGTIGGLLTNEAFDFDGEIENIFWINSLLPLQIFFSVVHKLKSAGGGTIVVFSSTAAHPVLATNAVYGRSKSFLEGVVTDFISLNRDEFKNGVQVSIVLPGFVATPMNLGRTPTLFSTSVEHVAESVACNLGRKIIWVPRIFQVVEMFLILPPLKKLAALLVLKSTQNKIS